MRLVHYLLIVCCVFLVAACASPDPTFPREETLTQELMPLQGITDPLALEVRHPFLIFQNRDTRSDSIFHIYDLNNYGLKSVFGRKGRGPGEFLTPWLQLSHLTDFMVLDAQNDLLFYCFDIDDQGQPVLSMTKRPAYDGIPNIAIIDDSLYVRDDRFVSSTLQVFDFDDTHPKHTWQYGDNDILIPWFNPGDGNLYANKSRVVYSYQYKKQIEFMDTDLNNVKRVKFKFDSPGIVNENNQLDVKRAYGVGYLGKRYFYTMYQGASLNEYYLEPDFRDSVLEVFDMDGNPVIRYRLDGLAPIYFVVDETTFTLYGFNDRFGLEDHLLVYRLKGLGAN